MMKMPSYWNSIYYDQDTNKLSKDAPAAMKDEWDFYNRQLETTKENYTVY
jgi:hypothetical protein